MSKASLYYCFLFCLLTYILQAQVNGRRPFLGIQMDAITEDTKRIMELPEVKGVLISRVIPGSTAEKIGIKKGDVLLKINDHEINSPAEGSTYVASQAGGSKFTYELIRDKKKIIGKSVFISMPEEHYPGLDVVYTDVTSRTGWERIILTKPNGKTSKLPLVVFLTGIGCYSLDSPFDTTKPEIQMLNKLSRAGYMCARVEKPGMGDNVGKSKKCEEIGFNDEVDMYVKAVNKLKKRDDVDSNSVYLFGHSMGGVIAPIVSNETSIKGIVAYGTIGSAFIDYMNKTRRTIAEAYNMPPDSADMFVKDCTECSAYYFVDKMTTLQAAAKKPICKDYLSVFDYRSRVYNDEMYAANIPAEWKTFSGKALLMWGASDYISAREDHKIITDAINYFHPGHAEFEEMPNTTHEMFYASNFQEARVYREKGGTYNAELGTAVLQWLQKN
ncbi:MAG TPA: PDZ domain-containing protein [Bacteroidia bacterium]|nr:PDZ domain-containing protein [Bacteroidia bacterium]